MPATQRRRPKKVLITGGRARLAACVRPELEANGCDVTLLSRTAGDGCLPLENFFKTPILDDADTVLHLAWSSLPATSEENVGMEWQTDLPLLFRVLRRMVASPRAADLHFVFLSSGGAVYGPSGLTPSREEDPCRPIGWYGRAKLAAEDIVRTFGDRHGLAYTILRVSNPYGFSVPFLRAQGIIPHAIDCARLGKTLSLWGDGSACKDFLHYTDFNRALERIIEQRTCGTYNLSYGSSATISEMIGLVERISGRQINLQRGEMRPWDVQTSRIDNRKLCNAIGWSPRLTLEEGLRLAAASLPVAAKDSPVRTLV